MSVPAIKLERSHNLMMTQPAAMCGWSPLHLRAVFMLLLLAVAFSCVTAAPTPQTPILRANATKPTMLTTTATPTTTTTTVPTTTTTPTTPTSSTTTETTPITALDDNPSSVASVSDAPLTTTTATSTTTDDIAADIADLFVANQDFSVIEALEVEAAAAADEEEEQQRLLGQSTTSVASVTTVTENSSASPSSDESGDIDDALFDVIVDSSSETPNQSALASDRPPAHHQVLEVDSEEFFVPADIKERDTTTETPVTMTTMTSTTTTPTTTPTPTTPPLTTTTLSINPDTADTVFYISNTEVKVGETPANVVVVQPHPQPSPPAAAAPAHTTPRSPRTHPQSDEELQFFPASYEEDVIVDVGHENSSGWRAGLGNEQQRSARPDRYEEDLIISQQKPDGAAPSGVVDENLSISYVGESYIEVKEFSRDLYATGAPPVANNVNFAEYVIIEPIAEAPIQPASSAAGGATAEPVVGVPVIEELPPALIRQYTAADQTPVDADDDQDNEILPPLPPQRPRHKSQQQHEHGLIQNPDDATAAVEHHRLGKQQVDVVPDVQVVMEEEVDGGYGMGGVSMLHDWLSGVFGKSLPAKRNNGGGGAAVAMVVGANETLAMATTSGGTVSLNETDGKATTDGLDDINMRWQDYDRVYRWVMPICLILIALCVFGSFYYYIFYGMSNRCVFIWLRMRSHDSEEPITKEPIAEKTGSSSLVVANQIQEAGSRKTVTDSDSISAQHSCTLTEHHYESIGNMPMAAATALPDTTSARPTAVEIQQQHNGGVEAPAASLMSPSMSSGASGSLITMTMKNNQLIVETEERNDIARDARETKVHYSPSEYDGVFVVEVARGADSVDAPNNYADQSMPAPLPAQPPRNVTPSTEPAVTLPQRDDVALLHNEEVQVHQPPPEASAGTSGADTEPQPPIQKTKTGLSQSDLSLTSSCDSNTGYTYGTQTAYTVDAAGYQTPVCQAQVVPPPIVAPLPEPTPAPAAAAPAAAAPVAAPTTPSPSTVPTEPIVVATPPVIRAAILKQENGLPPPPPHDDAAVAVEAQTAASPAVPAQPIKLTNGCSNGIPPSPPPVVPAGSVPPSPLTNGSNGCAGGGGGGGGGAFDSLLNLPEPPSMDEIQMLNEFGMSGDNNMDSLPPPPLEMMDTAGGGGIAVAGVN